MFSKRRYPQFCLALLLSNASTWLVAGDAADLAHFESRIRPVLVQHCYECHASDAKEVKGGLLLDSAQGVRTGGDSGPVVVAASPDESLLIQALRYDGLEMPPSGKLSDQVLRDFERWVQRGAPDPRVTVSTGSPSGPDSPEIDLDRGREFWAFQPVRDGSVPAVNDVVWAQTEVDTFVLSQLERHGMEPAPDADARTLVRRLYFDLIGLPPTPAQTNAYVEDPSFHAFARLVDQLLDSPQFGVHWGRHWLDVARYADSNGNDFNATFHDAWRYRDYVIQAFNADKPFDQFVREQIAGDLLPYETDAQRSQQMIATGFLMVGTKMLSERDKEKMTMDVVDEQINSVGQAFMGLTLGCARCHDHKFDPIPTTDYYALAGIFRSTSTLEGESQKYVSTWPRRELPADPDRVAKVREFEQQQSELKSTIAKLKKTKVKLTKSLQRASSASSDTTADDKTSQDSAEPGHVLAEEQQQLDTTTAELQRLEAQLAQLETDAPPPLPKTISVVDGDQIGDCELRIRGEHDNCGPHVPRGFVQVAMTRAAPEFVATESGRRELADWIVNLEHPLTARVIVNRVWHHLLGQGLVRTVDNFGQLGDRPSHPELLDRLASDFMRDDWSIKRTIRRIVLSRVYRSSSRYHADYWEQDPDNRFLWRANRKRLPAESIRDAMLSISHRLDLTTAGSPVAGLGVLVTQNSANEKQFKRHESLYRSAYLPIIRSALPEMLVAFDFADPDLVVGQRSKTNVPAQSLLLMNSPFVIECAEQAAISILASNHQTVWSGSELVCQAYERVLSRTPTESEQRRAVDFLARLDASISKGPDDDGAQDIRPLARLIHTLFASTEFRMLD